MLRKFIAVFVLCLFPCVAQAQFTINLTPTNGMSQDAIDGFQRAADFWEATLVDNTTINIDIDFRSLGNGILGSAGSQTQAVDVTDYYAGLATDVTSPDDATAVAGLSPLSGGALSFRTQVNTEGGSLAVSLDNDGSANNRVLNLNTANAKAIGAFTGNAMDSDANIAFSSNFTWDFDNSDGVDGGHQDFVGVAIHEIGHALGFNSGVDTVDFRISNTGDLEDFRVFKGMDMFRYSAADGILDLSVATDSYFSLDGGTTNLGLFSTGARNGDGRQASHWKDNLGLGIMDPTANPAGQINVVSDLDLQAFDVIGWDLAINSVPEPNTAMALGFAFAIGTLVRRRKNA